MSEKCERVEQSYPYRLAFLYVPKEYMFAVDSIKRGDSLSAVEFLSKFQEKDIHEILNFHKAKIRRYKAGGLFFGKEPTNLDPYDRNFEEDNDITNEPLYTKGVVPINDCYIVCEYDDEYFQEGTVPFVVNSGSMAMSVLTDLSLSVRVNDIVNTEVWHSLNANTFP